jgi:hypothetical protein
MNQMTVSFHLFHSFLIGFKALIANIHGRCAQLPMMIGQWIFMPVSGRLHSRRRGHWPCFDAVHQQPEVIQYGQQAGNEHQREDGGKGHAGGDGSAMGMRNLA